jgi:hypothetical protein
MRGSRVLIFFDVVLKNKLREAGRIVFRVNECFLKIDGCCRCI